MKRVIISLLLVLNSLMLSTPMPTDSTIKVSNFYNESIDTNKKHKIVDMGLLKYRDVYDSSYKNVYQDSIVKVKVHKKIKYKRERFKTHSLPLIITIILIGIITAIEVFK